MTEQEVKVWIQTVRLQGHLPPGKLKSVWGSFLNLLVSNDGLGKEIFNTNRS